jgi:hypothetical protein
MLTRALEWRQSTGIDNMAFLPEKPGFVRGWAMDRVYGLYDRPKRVVDDMDRVFDELQEVYHGTWHKWDREGNPVFIERTGISDPRAMVKIAKEGAARRGDGTTDDQILLEGHLVSMELGCHLTKVATERLGRPVFQFTYILDLKGYKLSHLHQPILTALKGIIENDKKYYPETTRHAFVVNAPGIVTVAWNFLSPILDARTRDKIQIMGSNYQPTLLKAIEPANLPTWLGGECDCKGGCVP